jgi:para-nitrobenzyl esterase
VSAGPIAVTEAGRVQGARRGDILEFRGVPYGRAERFAAPSAPVAWADVRPATTPGPAAPQPDRAVATFTHGARPATGEDCLALDVFTPGLTGSRPVLVWVHGGGFAIGSAAASLYDGADLAAAADIVVVAVGYRLGSLGWLGHPELSVGPGAPTANWGLLDQAGALRWVAANIGAFGGDPGRVTLGGQSAGALSAMDLLVCPAADGLFARAILQSPPLGDVAQPPQRARDWARALSRALSPHEEFDLAALRSAPTARLVALHEELLDAPAFRGTRGGALPTIDAATIPVSPRERPGARPAVDVLIGANADEGSFFFGAPWRPAPPPERIAAIVERLTGEPPESVLRRHRQDATSRGLAAGPLDLLRRIATEHMITGPIGAWAGDRARAVAADGGRVFRYRFDHPGAGPDLGATHTAEVPLLFGTWRDGGPGERLGGAPAPAGYADTADVAAALRAAWIRFIHGEDPGWAPVDAGGGGGEVGIFGGRMALTVAAPAARQLSGNLRAGKHTGHKNENCVHLPRRS